MRTLVHTECGSPSTTDLPNTSGGTVDSKIAFAVRRTLRYLGDTGSTLLLGSIDTVKDQQSYDIPSDRSIEDVIWNTSASSSYGIDIFSDQFANIPGSSLAGYGGSYFRSDELIAEMKQAQFWDTHYHFEIFDRKIWLYPIPTNSEHKIWYTYYDTLGDITVMPIEYERAILYAATADCLRYLANKFRGRALPSREEGFAKYEKSAELLTSAKDYDDQFKEEILELAGGL